MQPFTVPARITKAQTLTNGDLKLSIKTTKEIDPKEVAKMMQYNQEEGWLLFSPQEPEQSDVPDVDFKPIKKRNKSMSQKLREVIWRYQEQEVLGREPEDDEAEEYYEKYMTKLIENIKDKLD